MIIIYNRTNINHESEFKLMKKNKLFLALMAGTIVISGCSAKSEKKEENKSAQVDTSKGTKEQLKQATELYKKFVENQVDTLLKDTEKFAETIKAGNLEEAKKQYPLIRMAYERSEPIAESFGELDVNIDFRLADYLEENKTEDGWRGFHRIEKIMWENNTTKGTEEYADQLVKDVKELKAKVATVEVTPDLMVTGAVDLLNEVATQKITGEEEIFSHTDLYDFKANIEGAEEIFKIFKPLIEKKDSKLAKDLVEKFATINGLLDKYKTDDKHYKLYTDLTKENTKELSEAVTKLGEPLSQMGVILDEEAK
jgi:protein ycdO